MSIMSAYAGSSFQSLFEEKHGKMGHISYAGFARTINHDNLMMWKGFTALMALCEGDPPVAGGFLFTKGY